MRFIHLLLAFAVAVGVSAAHFKRDFSPVYGINLLTSQTQSIAALLGNVDLADLLLGLEAFGKLENTITTVTIHVQGADSFPELESQAIVNAAQGFKQAVELVSAELTTHVDDFIYQGVAIEENLLAIEVAVEHFIKVFLTKISVDCQEDIKAIGVALEALLKGDIKVYGSASIQQ